MFNPVIAGLDIMFNGSKKEEKESCEHEWSYDYFEYSDDNEDGMDYTTLTKTCKKCGEAIDIKAKE